ncbi:DoxX family protein [Devosia honganensis]|uniref:DoxX family protein n=1 Tax=Devosia honganensis TaxID=1610527 RepID=A0ABV7X018_9HYPH
MNISTFGTGNTAQDLAARFALGTGVSSADLAATLLRVSTGGLFLAHAWLKLVIYTPAGTVGFFESLGFPGFLAYLVIAAELVGGVALIAGVRTRWASLALVPILLGSIYAPHGAAGFYFDSQGGGWEFPAFWAIVLIAQALLGNGAFALKRNRA